MPRSPCSPTPLLNKAASTSRLRACLRPSPRPSRQTLRAEGRAAIDQRGAARLSQAADLHPRRICSEGPRRRFRRMICPTATHSTASQVREYTTTDLTPEQIHEIGSQGSRADRRRDAQDDARERLQGRPSRLPPLPEDRPAILREDAGRAAGCLGLCRQARGREDRHDHRAAAAPPVRHHPGARTRWRPSTRRGAAGSRIA